MRYTRQSLARRPSLSTIDSIDSTRSPLSPDPGRDSGSKEIQLTLKRKQSAYFQPYIPSPATINQTWIPPTTTMEQNLSRPPMVRVPSTETEYMRMLLHLDEIPRVYNFMAGFCVWILLSSFLIVPGTFTSFKNSDMFKNVQNDEDKSSAIAKAIINSAANVGLLWVSVILFSTAVLGCLFLWFRWRKNYLFLVSKVFLPATLNGVAGLLTTIVSVYTAQDGVWSITAKITAITTGCLIAVAGGLFGTYNFWLLESVRGAHTAAYLAEEK